MTFRGRLVLVAAIAVVAAVLAACAAAYVASRDSLIGSIDGTLSAQAQSLMRHQFGQPRSAGLDYQFVAPNGELVVFRGTAPSAGRQTVPVTGKVKAVASNSAPSYFDIVTLNGAPYRELVVYAGKYPVSATGLATTVTVTSVALQVVLPLGSVNQQLTHLRWGLVLIAIAGIVVAVLLAWLVGRTAMVPLDDLTAAVEDVAATTDVSRRLDPGGPDELGRLRRAFNHLLAALERSQQSQRQLVLDAGHELRTPLTSLRTNLEVVRRLDELPPEERTVLVDDLLTQMGELTNLVADLSELARGDQRHQGPATFRLDRLVEDAVGMATSHGRLRDVHFELHAQPTWMTGQRDRVARAVGNLLDNALKWSPDGGVVDVQCADGRVTVRDHGPGISPEDLPHIFDRFYRSAAARRLPGSGLGLAIVAQVAEAEGGSVTAGQVADGPGAVFTLSFPAVAPPPPGRPAADGSGGRPDDEDDGDDGDGDGDDGDDGELAYAERGVAGADERGADERGAGGGQGVDGGEGRTLDAGGEGRTTDTDGSDQVNGTNGTSGTAQPGVTAPGWGLPGS